MPMDNEVDLLFVYGSLRRGFRNPAASRLKRASLWLGRGTIGARLYDLGAYPGAVPSRHARDRVEGDLVRLLAPSRMLPALDRYELCDAASPRPHLYRREQTLVRLTGGREVAAWTYFYQLPVSKARRIVSGVWSGPSG
jgi:gamma-glutamylcyclotransferase (GGCT)/AIG2-like uncharacterized protein YtfP